VSVQRFRDPPNCEALKGTDIVPRNRDGESGMIKLLLVRLLIAMWAGLFLPCSIASAAAANSDSGAEYEWQLAGFSDAHQSVALFILASEIKREPAGKVQVWTKALSLSRLQHMFDMRGKDAAFVNRVAAKVAAHYVPAIAQVKTITLEQSIEFVAFEDIANEQDAITPEMRILFEIDCAQSIYRTMSIVTKTGSSRSVPGGWEPVPPESTIRSIKKLTCTH
jgi:hypothetical protein